MKGHKICFYGEIWKIIPKLSLLPFLSGPDQTAQMPDDLGMRPFHIPKNRSHHNMVCINTIVILLNTLEHCSLQNMGFFRAFSVVNRIKVNRHTFR